MSTHLHYRQKAKMMHRHFNGSIALETCRQQLLPARHLLLIAVALGLLPVLGQAQTSTKNTANRGFETGNNTPAHWSDMGSGIEAYNATNPRTGSFAGSYSTNSTTNQRWDQPGYAISVPAGQYVHVIYWSAAIGSSNRDRNRSRLGIVLSNHTPANNYASEHTPGTSYGQRTYSRQNIRTGTETAYPTLYTRSSNGSTITAGYDDMVIYTSNSSTTDITSPGNASCFSISERATDRISLFWTNGTDGGTGATGVQGTLILRHTGNSGTPGSLNNQGTYATIADAASDGVRTPTLGWNIIADVPASTTTYSDNSVVSGTTYRYTVIHYDKGLNYSTPATPINATAAAPSAAFPDISQSIQNLTKGATGGTFNEGDNVRINVSFSVPNGLNIYNVRTRIFLPPQLSYVANSMAILDNKEWAYNPSTVPLGGCSQTYSELGSGTGLTDAAANDRGRFVAGATPYAEIMLGEIPTGAETFTTLENNTNGFSGGRLRGGFSTPLFYSNQTIIVASIRATIIAPVGSSIPITSESFYSFYERAATAQLVSNKIDAVNNADRFIELAVSDAGLPASYTGRGVNLFSIYNNGTFGRGTNVDGSTLPGNPSSSPNFVLQNITTPNQPNDGNFSVSKNTSTGQLPGFNEDYAINHSGRVFGHWYILNDHTEISESGAPAAGVESGYMMVVNADYVPKRVVSQTVNDLCPGTFYNFSAWFRNICPSCGVNSNTGSNLRDYPADPRRQGVRPNLTFDVGNRAYYTTGPIDTAVGWVKKEFIFATGTNSGNFDFSIRNNANGGDGNDWAIDDIQILTRGPVATASVSADPFIDPNPASFCAGQRFKIIGSWLESTGSFTQYDTYQFQWSYGQNGPWNALGSVTEIAAPNDPYNPTNGRIDSTISAAFTDRNRDVYFRIVVATQTGNVSLQDAAPCQVTAFSSSFIRIADCVLPVSLLKFNAARIGRQVVVQWNTADAITLKHFELERSKNGMDFSTISIIDPQQHNGRFEFGYTDQPLEEADRYYYRLKMVHENGQVTYSKIESVAWRQSVLTVSVQPNPARDFVVLNWSGVQPNQQVQVSILSTTGQVIHHQMVTVQQGPSQRMQLPNIPAGLYILQVTDAAKQLNYSTKLSKL